MKKIITLLGFLSFYNIQAQTVKEVTGIRLYDHHSSDVTGMPFGTMANGSKSGYDFVKRAYQFSFDTVTMGAYSKGEEANLDMVENDGAFGTNGSSYILGFTSGASSIWGGQIKGNGTTRWHKVLAGASFYDTVNTYTAIAATYNPSIASQSIAEVKPAEVYIGKIRSSDLYVLIKCTSINTPLGPPNGGNDNSYFNFDYKYVSKTSGLPTAISQERIFAYPNPVKDVFTLSFNMPINEVPEIHLFSATGAELPFTAVQSGSGMYSFDVAGLNPGCYFMMVTEGDSVYRVTFIRE